MNATLQDINLWEIWIEYDEFHPEYFGTLYIHGEVWTDDSDDTPITKIKGKLGELKLLLPEKPEYFTHTKEVVYSEPIRNLNQYTSVSIYAGDELISCFDDIEIMI